MILLPTIQETLHATFTVGAIVLFAWAVADWCDDLRARFSQTLEQDGKNRTDLDEHGEGI